MGGDVMSDEHVLRLDTKLSVEALEAELRKYEPWGHRVDFRNGVSTAQYKRRTPFAENLLAKFHAAARRIPFEQLRGGMLLDIGSNYGNNSIHSETNTGMQGVDI